MSDSDFQGERIKTSQANYSVLKSEEGEIPGFSYNLATTRATTSDIILPEILQVAKLRLGLTSPPDQLSSSACPDHFCKIDAHNIGQGLSNRTYQTRISSWNRDLVRVFPTHNDCAFLPIPSKQATISLF